MPMRMLSGCGARWTSAPPLPAFQKSRPTRPTSERQELAGGLSLSLSPDEPHWKKLRALDRRAVCAAWVGWGTLGMLGLLVAHTLLDKKDPRMPVAQAECKQ